MRLGQLARKYNIKQDEVIRFLNEAQAELSPFHHNSKLSDDMENLVTDHFSILPEEEEETKDEPSVDIPVEADEQDLDVSEIDDDKKTEADLQRELDPTLPPIKIPVIETKDEKTIETDRLLELLEADEESNDLSKITHIKASKKELSGLKVVGKIELAVPKSKSIENQDKEPKPAEYSRNKSQRLSEEAKDKTRLKVKEQKEKYVARQEKRRIAEEKEKKKAQNKAHYDKKMQKSTTSRSQQKTQKEEVVPEVTDQPQTAKPIAIFDWFWKLFGL